VTDLGSTLVADRSTKAEWERHVFTQFASLAGTASAVEISLGTEDLTHAALESPIDGSALEVPSDILLYNNARAQHATGIQLRALLLDRRILVRGGFYEGARNTNPSTAPALNPQGVPLTAGMIRLNIVGNETRYA